MVSPSRILQLHVSGRRNLDREELELFLVIGARHAVGAQQRAAIDLEAVIANCPFWNGNRIAGGSEAEKRSVSGENRKNLLR